MAGGTWRMIRNTLLHKKVYDPAHVEDTTFKRCLSRWDACALGVGSTLGVGVYALVGGVALRMAGPSVVLSFLVAAVAALFAGLCYAEFVARVPKAGVAYNYTYVGIGEAVAFLVGWNNILEGLFGAASVARGLSLHVDAMTNATMSRWFLAVAPVAPAFMSPHFDFFACLLVIFVGALLSYGALEASLLNKLFCAVNIVFVIFIIIAGAIAADSANWSLPLDVIPDHSGSGGFFPYGMWGTLSGAAVCFYGFVGFDVVCAASEEVREPRRVIPMTIVSVIMILLLLNTSVAVVVSMMVPYYLQESFNSVAAAFSYVEWEWAKWIVSVGALFGLYSSLFGCMFPLPRLVAAMSRDALLPRFFSRLTARQSPALATLISTALIACLAGLFELEPLLLMMCFGTLLSYTTVAISVIIMRYRSDYTPGEPKYLKQIIGIGRSPTRASACVAYVSLLLFICCCICIAVVTSLVEEMMIPSAALHAAAMLLLLVITVQPHTKHDLPFKTPLVPLIPCLSIYINIHLMMCIKVETWIRVGIWTAIGILIYMMTLCCIKREKNNLKDNITLAQANLNGKSQVQIIVESPTPPDTLSGVRAYGEPDIQHIEEIQLEQEIQQLPEGVVVPHLHRDLAVHQAVIENNEEKEAKIIDLLDQVLQAEEDSYGEMISLKDIKEEDETETNETENDTGVIHRKSLSELSDAGSDASLGNQGLSKYDVIAQVHREDLPRVNEEEEKSDRDDVMENDSDNEQVTAFNDSDTNSRTDESGYSDTLDRNPLSESLEESKEDIPYIPVPPPLDENFFRSSNFKKSYTIAPKHMKRMQQEENVEEENRPRESINSNVSLADDNITFGSDRQIHFMSKLENIFQNKITSSSDEEEPRKRSHSTGNAVESSDLSIPYPRPPLFMALKNEIISKEAAQNLRPVNVEEKQQNDNGDSEEEEEDVSLSRQDLKHKLENIFAAGGPQLLKPRLMKSNPPTPEESYHTDNSSTDSIPKLPKMEKNDTLKRQKDKFGEVLNSFRLSINKDDAV